MMFVIKGPLHKSNHIDSAVLTSLEGQTFLGKVKFFSSHAVTSKAICLKLISER